MPDDPELDALIARIGQAMKEGVNRPGMKAEVYVSDLRLLLAELERRKK